MVGLGHMAVKLASSMGAEVNVLSRSQAKQKDAKRLGAHHFEITTDEDSMKRVASSFDFIIDTISAEHDYNDYLKLLRTNQINEAYERTLAGDVHYRFVIDMASLN